MGVDVITYEDTVSKTQNENLNRIVSFHNAQGVHDLDVSVHFNSTDPQPSGPVGCEVLYTSSNGQKVAKAVVDAICTSSGLKNRGPKQNNGLYFLNNTKEVAVLVEVCFVNSLPDVDIYHDKFSEICTALASGVSGDVVPGPTPPSDVLFQAKGACSWFGGPNDNGVSSSEGLAFIFNVSEAPHLFLPSQPSGTTGLARRLNPYVDYIACRWDYAITPKTMLRDSGQRALVRANGWEMLAFPADWGPHGDTNRVADLSPSLMEAFGITTDDEVEVFYPWKE